MKVPDKMVLSSVLNNQIVSGVLLVLHGCSWWAGVHYTEGILKKATGYRLLELCSYLGLLTLPQGHEAVFGCWQKRHS